ncbi:hypothetical protein QYM36_012975 [Artemia franciscana]|uniref:Inositol-pentakisphosphate 2-kinase n=1 Tax=Artemia franciscana TaxID=6661 RepID=A0AA88HP38_ARTSF|nr:hypothetical protein QYM36_012975 [Artemia franciscana]
MVVEFLESDLSQMQKDAEKQNARNDHINSEKIPKFFLVGKEWEYRGEGNGSIVLSLPKDKIIIRITKVGDNEQMSFRDSIEVKNMIPNPAYPIGTLKETMERLVFSENVIGKLLEGSLVKKGTIYHMEPSEIQKLSAILDPIRPDSNECGHSGYLVCDADFEAQNAQLQLKR